MRILGLTILAGLLLSCGRPAGGVETQTGRGPVSELVYADGNTSRQEHQSVQEFIIACMSSEGWDYKPETFEEVEVVPLATLRSREYRAVNGLTGEAHDDSETGLVDDPNAETLSRLGPVELDRWLQSVQSCTEEAHIDLNDGPTLDDALIEEVEMAVAFTHPALADSVVRWSGCMAEEGYSFVSPYEAYDYAYDLYSDAEPDRSGSTVDPDADPTIVDEDIEVALADHDCSQLTIWPASDELLAELDAKALAAQALEGSS